MRVWLLLLCSAAVALAAPLPDVHDAYTSACMAADGWRHANATLDTDLIIPLGQPIPAHLLSDCDEMCCEDEECTAVSFDGDGCRLFACPSHATCKNFLVPSDGNTVIIFDFTGEDVDVKNATGALNSTLPSWVVDEFDAEIESILEEGLGSDAVSKTFKAFTAATSTNEPESVVARELPQPPALVDEQPISDNSTSPVPKETTSNSSVVLSETPAPTEAAALPKEEETQAEPDPEEKVSSPTETPKVSSESESDIIKEPLSTDSEAGSLSAVSGAGTGVPTALSVLGVVLLGALAALLVCHLSRARRNQYRALD